MSCKKSLLQIRKISNLFTNTLSADVQYSFLDRDNLTQRIQMQLSKTQKTFSEFFSSFLKSSLNLKPFQKEDDTYSGCISEITDSKEEG